jgi:hypothetical protein
LVFILLGDIVEPLVELLQVQGTAPLSNGTADKALIANLTWMGPIDTHSYVSLGLSSFALSYVAYVCISSAAERQIRRIK